MTIADTTTSTTLRLLSAVNEAVIGHEDEDVHVIGALRDVAEAVNAFAQHFSEEVAATVVRDLKDAQARPLLQAVVRANKTANGYLARLHTSGLAFVGTDLELLAKANTMTAEVIAHDNLIEA